MAVEQDRDAACLESLDQGPHIAPPDRVEVGGRLIEDQQLGSAEYRLRDAEPLLHPFRVLADLAVLSIEARERERLGGAALAIRSVEAAQAGARGGHPRPAGG